jgi:ADP-heptose:LPS heptosyltransferase
VIRVAGFLGGQYGDQVVATVALRAFKEVYPDSEFTWCVAEKFAGILPLFYHHPLISDHHVWEGYDSAWPTAADREYIVWRGFYHVFHPLAGHSQHDWYNHRSYGAEACVRYGLTPPADLSYELNAWFRLRTDCKRVVTLSLFPSKGTQLNKGLRMDQAEALCIALRKLGYTCVQLGGRFEPKLENAVAPSMSILEATTLMLSSALHVTGDTGFSSIAAGYHHPTIGFYGNRNYPDQIDCSSHLPPNRNAHYLRNVVPNEVTAEELITVAREKGLLAG